MDSKRENVKTAIEIGTMAGQLNTTNQSYVLNTINALLFSQQTNEQAEPNKEKSTGRMDQDKQK